MSPGPVTSAVCGNSHHPAFTPRPASFRRAGSASSRHAFERPFGQTCDFGAQ